MPAAKGFNMIYYVEDDDNIRDLTVYALRKQGIEAEGFSCDGEFKAAVARRVPDAVLLDIMLPDTDGLAIMRRLRADRLTATVPIMMLTAKDTELDKVMALDGGADDYLTKPFSLMELASRCRALLRRGGMVKQASDVLSVGDIVLSPSHREVTVAGEPLEAHPARVRPARVPHAQARRGFYPRVVAAERVGLGLRRRFAHR